MHTFEAETYDVIVVGAGHAGSEAALAAARMGCETLLLTLNLDMVAFMPCNPSIGGPAKGVVVREIDALGGEMGRNIDKTYIQMRLLNTSKGPAVQALRAQADKNDYAQTMKQVLEDEPNLTLRQGLVERLVIEDGVCKGVITDQGAIYRSKAVVLTAGTSSRGKIHIGEVTYSSGPNNTLPSIKLSEHLLELGIELARFKTGTPARVHRDSLNFDKMLIQPGDEEPNHFSFMTPDEDYLEESVPCWLTHTNLTTHEIIQENIHRTPMYSGIIEGVGARYCPSIEDKITRFSDKPRHQVFIEPEGLTTKEMYVQGLSTSLPEEVQISMLRSIEGLEEARLMRPGYAIEYDVVIPHQLQLTLELKTIESLFTAGQMNGTSGYEEAAGQGLIAGINAALKVQGKEPFILQRSEAYIGVMIDDLVTKGTTEPYRLLTSRAEYRLLLRHDNADLRLTQKGFDIGLVKPDVYEAFTQKKQAVEMEIERLSSIRLTPNTPGLSEYMERVNSTPLKDGILASELLRRPEIKYHDLVEIIPHPEGPVSRQVGEQVEIQIKYDGYIAKANRKVEKVKAMENRLIPEHLDYDQIDNLAVEARERLKLIQPRTLAQASRVSGVNPSDIAVLSVYIKQGKAYETKEEV
ncbi:tRNA uridine-5-carboxymethylaminomethyl(34) synthesis enzyme MnmG [Dolosicoccus paucivorans]|uniref:tRNA uridine 5-carboxymethylaminomethyl modification enzyme MnmG n=1 Tax=Dolosicoccus paucivorans TaxID=84521 RepID=A0A2N6SNY8_9LACT|nr:tRNA uridine-5-carboxymethylaminomethyl(34) synthesis enzyme MnmG [Dolosicoccus paucivorans]PMB84749.1 tRNA uridine-5-carboxymethylaminomethyl(34) synthesis enzyme MnmG [Dolosicoccus paucivorans]PMC58781.1 tRNA uridine-5-carboxymethylaminomethyl(34) synthesis enzyme MnmG [Dolosicoccus paucivorans]